MAADPTRSSVLPPTISSYIAARIAPPDQVLVDLKDRTAQLGRAAGMQISADQGALLTLLTRLVGVDRAVEVGTFTGYSSICIARGLRPGGHLLCCDVNEDYTAIARDAWAAAGLDDRIELRLAPAVETLRSLPSEPTIDLAFIDADKGGYASYYRELVPRVRSGGLLLVDNTLWSGRVVDPRSESDRFITGFNDVARNDPRVELVILPIADGLTMARRLP